MNDNNIELSIIELKSLLYLQIQKSVNQHGTARVIGMIDNTEEDSLFLAANREKYVFITMEGDTAQKSIIFAGIISSFEVSNTGGVVIATIDLQGATRILDREEKSASYQNIQMTYETLIVNTCRQYDECICDLNCGNNDAIGQLIVQYKETDWEFMKRMSSHFHQPVIPSFGRKGIYFQFGLNTKLLSHELQVNSYKCGNAKEEYIEKSKNNLQTIRPDDFTYYIVESRDYYDLGEAITFRGEQWYIYEANTEYKTGELLHTYVLRKMGGFVQNRIDNYALVGASLDASVLETERDNVKIHLNIDNMQDISKALYFPYSTVYSSSDGTGWFCMPEVGDRVRLYFPNEKEENAYVISSIHQEVDNSSGQIPRSNPDKKSISNKYQKQIELTPSSIMMTNNKGMSIVLDDDKGITIKSDKKVYIKADDNITIKSDSVMNVKASKSIEFKQGNNKILMKDQIMVESSRLKVQ